MQRHRKTFYLLTYFGNFPDAFSFTYFKNGNLFSPTVGFCRHHCVAQREQPKELMNISI